MDNIINVAGREKPDAEEVILYPEGIFYRAYGYSALRFIRHIRPYQVKKRYYKKLGGELCYIGFPQSALESLPGEGYRTEKTAEGTVVICGPFGEIAPEEYEAWVESIPLSVAKPRAPTPDGRENPPSGTSSATGRAGNDEGENEGKESDGRNRENEGNGNAPAYTQGMPMEREVLYRLRSFALESATPLGCMLFLSDLKKRLNG